jgi:hypothetical protein
MNYTALKAALSSPNFRCRLGGALRKTAILKHTVAHVVNAKGVPCLAVRHRPDIVGGFEYRNAQGRVLDSRMVRKLLQAA